MLLRDEEFDSLEALCYNFNTEPEKIKAALDKAGYTAVTMAGYDFDLCLRLCREKAPEGGCVLLSPACASFDMFKDFEDRGRIFKEKVMALR